MPASNHRCVGELLPPVGAVHGLWGTENGLQEVLVDLQQKRGGGREEEGEGLGRRRMVWCLAALICKYSSRSNMLWEAWIVD